MDRRADIVQKTWESQRIGACATADLVSCFEHDHRPSGTSENDGGRQAVWPGTDHNAVVFASANQSLALSYADRMIGGNVPFWESGLPEQLI